jgi:hypothetical protein
MPGCVQRHGHINRAFYVYLIHSRMVLFFELKSKTNKNILKPIRVEVSDAKESDS